MQPGEGSLSEGAGRGCDRRSRGGQARFAGALREHRAPHSSETPNAILTNQYANPANPEIHYRTTGPEIWEATEGRITHFVAAMGTGGTISGAGRFLKEKNPNIRIIGADPYGSVFKTFKETGRLMGANPYLVEGIG